MKEEKQIDWRQAAREARREGKADKLHFLFFLFLSFCSAVILDRCGAKKIINSLQPIGSGG